MKRAAYALLLALFLNSAVVAQAAFDFQAEREKLLELLADEHTDIGREFAKATIYSDARFHFSRAVVLVREFDKAMKAQGYEKKDGRWVLNPKDALPLKDGLSGDKLTAERERLGKKRDAAYKRLADKIRAAARRARDAQAAEDALALESFLNYYAPDDAEARKARGHVKIGEEWGPSFAKAAREAGAKHLQEAGEGEKVAEEDPQGKVIGARLWVRKGTHIVARAVESDDRAARLHRVLEGIVRLGRDTLKVEGPVFNGRQFTGTVVQRQEQYLAMVEKLSGKTGSDLELARKLAGSSQKDPWGFFCREGGWPSGDDMLGNTVAINVLYSCRGGVSEPWINTGFSYLMTGRLLGTTNTVRYTVKEEGQTAVGGGAEEPDLKKKSEGPQKLRALALFQAQTQTDTSLRALAVLDLNSLNMEHAAKAFSFFEFLFEKHPDKARQWLKLKPGQKAAEIANLEKALGVTVEELDSQWRRWVLTSY